VWVQVPPSALIVQLKNPVTVGALDQIRQRAGQHAAQLRRLILTRLFRGGSLKSLDLQATR
jgi:hypothetical protein